MRIEPRSDLSDISAYRPGSHDADQDGLLASNESPYRPSDVVRQAVTAASNDLHRYPDPVAAVLCAEIATLHGVDARQVLVGNGSDELIYLLTWAFAANGGSVVTADPAYRINELSATIAGASVARVPLRTWTHDLEAMSRSQGDIAFVVNPHNPTGTALGLAQIREFVRTCQAKIPVIDEAYIDFAEPDIQTAIPLAAAGDAMVLRTFSKVHGLAGVRLGYMIGDPEVLDVIRKIRPPFSVGTVAQRAGVAALRDVESYTRTRESVMRNRAGLHRALEAHGFRPVSSHANFILVPDVDEDDLVRRLADHGIAVRPGASLGVRNAVRISVPGDRGLERISAALATLNI